MTHFNISQPLPNVYHIQDVSKVCFTLIVGEQDTLLWDTGTGFYNVAECIAPYVRGKLHVVLSHGHYDHVCGCRYFDSVSVHPDDLALCKESISKQSMDRSLSITQRNNSLDDDFDSSFYQSKIETAFHPIKDSVLDLGDFSVHFKQTVGHTLGSMIAYVPERKLLLTGDMWNPQTWLFFRESQPLSVYTRTMKGLYNLQAEHVLCSHDHAIRTMAHLRLYIDGLNDQTFNSAEPCDIFPYYPIHTMRCCPEPDSILIFNYDKR